MDRVHFSTIDQLVNAGSGLPSAPQSGLRLTTAQAIAQVLPAIPFYAEGTTSLVVLSPGEDAKGDRPGRVAGYAVRRELPLGVSSLDSAQLLALLALAAKHDAELTVRADSRDGEDVLVYEFA